jgi:serine protease Do
VLIVTSDSEIYGQVVRIDAQRDVALVKAEGTTNYPLKTSTKEVRIGEQIYAVGTPLSEELSFSMTRGIISGKRSVNGLPLLQTDAAINPGNSSGPVLNENGDVVEISVSGIFSKSGGSLNTNFVIPIDDALQKLGL